MHISTCEQTSECPKSSYTMLRHKWVLYPNSFDFTYYVWFILIFSLQHQYVTVLFFFLDYLSELCSITLRLYHGLYALMCNSWNSIETGCIKSKQNVKNTNGPRIDRLVHFCEKTKKNAPKPMHALSLAGIFIMLCILHFYLFLFVSSKINRK